MTAPRAVIVTRATVLQSIARVYGSGSNARYNVTASDELAGAGGEAYAAVAAASLGTRGNRVTYEAGARKLRRVGASRSLAANSTTLNSLQQQDSDVSAVISRVSSAIPDDWRTTRIQRTDLDRFVFEPDDVIIVVGQDGLVANVAKYLIYNQPVIGINPEPSVNPGVLVPWQVRQFNQALSLVLNKSSENISKRTMVQAVMDNGQTLVALNEVFVGHRSHQSARYYLTVQSQENTGASQEHQSSSGLICFTGTGSTGWASSCLTTYKAHPRLWPNPTDEFCGFFVREPWLGSASYGGRLVNGVVTEAEGLLIRSEMEDGGVIFGDGIESDFLDFSFGKIAALSPSPQKLNLVVP